ncbi:uncharacterized protein CLAFUR5_02023 [Fulvia fulva]|uniref:Uncharacterized protein n=1 Tax=Passalora fulva TaxID=5499 RepID=A0A9Q8L7Z1_PASFU|nr:uncharacterized protein CLAFUR5_02023 [Fulvia fulva]KAK4637829.1 hypothetical protein CLAFUR0_02028 [Fulvia fulva]UJO12528.1 hypothetical protein CLAFUR5_02023 [Fulvia fulva]
MHPPSPSSTPDDAASNTQQPKPRRFVPKPIETITKSSKTARKHSPEKQEAGQAPKVRRFAPEPVETTTRSSKSTAAKQDTKPAIRRFAPQPIETSQKTSKDRTPSKSRAHIRFKPDLVETTYGGNRKSSRRSSAQSETTSNIAPEDVTSRKFKPEVISTARRSRRAGDLNDANYQDYRTEEGFVIHAREHQKHAGLKSSDEGQARSETGEGDHAVSPRGHECPPELRRQISPLDGSAPARPSLLKPERQHSFRCPELDTIESSESERNSARSSLSGSPGQGSPITASDSSFNEFYKHATRTRESVDESFSQYLLDLEAKRARQRLQEQALAAFPNSDFHEPVQHYVNDDHDSFDMEIEDRPVTWEGFDEEEYNSRPIRRESTKVNWDQLELQRHAEEREQERRANNATAAKKEPPKENSPWWSPAAGASIHQPDNEMRSMRDRARPPMLGRDLMFPRCPSPEPARFDVTQGCERLRQQMCYLSEQLQNTTTANVGGLWCSPAAKKPEQKVSPATSTTTAKLVIGKGLWGGFCIQEKSETPGLAPPTGPTGLMTPAPRVENLNPFEQSFSGRGDAGAARTHLTALATPPTPPESVHGTATDLGHLDTVLATERDFEQTFEKEFPDSFITQVFNYLSLGYPTLARPFDEELSKIARIPVSELRQDDIKAKQSPRGYIRLGPDFESVGGERLTTENCVRWQALKLYVREWARQEKNMVQEAPPGGNWATTNRRGSWAF